jgi:lysophospholipase L1-like esterase
MRTSKTVVVTVLMLALAMGGTQSGAAENERWVGTWATGSAWRLPVEPVPRSAPPLAPQRTALTLAPAAPVPPLRFNNQTLRQVVRTSIGGSRIRVVLSNVFGTAPLRIGAASVALRSSAAALVAESIQRLTFGSRPSTTIPAGAVVVSDPVALAVPAAADLAIDLFLPMNSDTWSAPLTIHHTGLQTNYLSREGDHTGKAFSPAATMTSWFLLARVEVMAPASSRAVVAIGDSITDGTHSTIDANNRWPDVLARRLQSESSTRDVSVLNVGIAGNRLLSEATPNFGINALARFDRDVLAQPGVAYVVVLEGINDIGIGARSGAVPSAVDLIAGHRQLVERAHTKGLKIFGATLLPYEGAFYFTWEGEATRRAVNQWIRMSKVYDAVIDFDAVVRDPNNRRRLLPAYDSGDKLHPSDAGYKAMAEAIDLKLFK